MLVITRRRGELTFIIVPPSAEPTTIIHEIIAVFGDRVRNGYTAPETTQIYREEVQVFVDRAVSEKR